MATETTQVIPIVAFAISGLLAGGIVLRFSVRAERSSKRLRQVLAKAGVASRYPDDYPASWRFTFYPDSIRDSNDSVEIRDAKEEVISWGKRLPHMLLCAMLVAVFGTAISAALGLLEFYLARK